MARNTTEINPIIENWLSTVAYSHSNSKNTRIGYIYNFKRFLEHSKKTPEQILNDYNLMEDKQFKQYYSPLIMSFIVKLQKEDYSPSSQQYTINTVKSFFKYNNLPLNYIPTGHKFIIFHNRDIEKDEIEEIVKDAEPREKAFYVLMTQSGLRPNEICNLKIENFEELLNENTPIPCLIKISQEQTKGQYSEYFTFAGQESIYYIKEYLKRRTHPLRPEDRLFTKEDNVTPVNTDLLSHMFRRTVTRLKEQNILDFKNKKSQKTNRNELRLYNLRKYFRNHAGNAGQEFVNFWMGHSLGVDDHYFSKTNIPKHRQQYQDFAMPNLRIGSKTPNQTEQAITELQSKLMNKDKELESIKTYLSTLLETIELIANTPAYKEKAEKQTIEATNEIMQDTKNNTKILENIRKLKSGVFKPDKK